jgi:hypothetical protein
MEEESVVKWKIARKQMLVEVFVPHMAGAKGAPKLDVIKLLKEKANVEPMEGLKGVRKVDVGKQQEENLVYAVIMEVPKYVLPLDADV